MCGGRCARVTIKVHLQWSYFGTSITSEEANLLSTLHGDKFIVDMLCSLGDLLLGVGALELHHRQPEVDVLLGELALEELAEEVAAGCNEKIKS